jgi:acyl-CoA synthetase (AMP-forming)/AMP-acid ligase II
MKTRAKDQRKPSNRQDVLLCLAVQCKIDLEVLLRISTVLHKVYLAIENVGHSYIHRRTPESLSSMVGQYGFCHSLLGNMPLFHVHGNAGAFAVAIVGHNPLALVPNPRDIPDLLHTIQQTKTTFFPGVPALFNALINHTDVQSGKVSLRSVKACISGAAPAGRNQASI